MTGSDFDCEVDGEVDGVTAQATVPALGGAKWQGFPVSRLSLLLNGE